MPSYDVTIKATVTKTIRVDDCDTVEQAIEEAHSLFTPSNVGDEPEKYTEEFISAEEVK
jgi:hypothetical protein